MRSDGQTVAVTGAAAVQADVDVRGLSQALWRARGWVIVPTLAAALIAMASVMTMTPRYTSEARLLIEGRENVFLRPEAEKAGERERGVDAESVRSQVQLILSKDLATRVIKQLKLGERPEFDPLLQGFAPLRFVLGVLGIARDTLAMTPEERVLDSYFSKLSAYPLDKSRVIAIEFTSFDPALAARVANTVAETYLVMQQAVRQQQTRTAGRWLAGEIDTLRAKVADAEARVEEQRGKADFYVGANNTPLSSQQLGELNSQVSAARAQKTEMEARARLIRDLLRRGVPIEASEVLNSDLMRRLSEQRASLRAQLAEQSSTLLDQHPRIKELRAQIGEIDRQIKSEAEKLARTFETDARLAGARVEGLSANLDQAKRQTAQNGDQDIKLRSLEREAKAQRELLESYLAKYREATARDSLDASAGDTRIISGAVVSNTPAFPKKLPIVIVATFATLLLSTGVVLSGALMRLGTGESLEAAPQAAEPPLQEVAAEPRLQGVAAEPPLQEATAAVSSPAIRPPPEAPARSPVHHRAPETALLLAAGEARVIAVVAAAWNGTGAALRLARARARDCRVVYVDCLFDAPGEQTAGLADLVAGQRAFSEIITMDAVSRAHCVAAGGPVRDGDALWESERLSVALDALARSYDVVILDAGVPSAKAAPRLARIATRALLVTDGAAPDTVVIARERLVAAGFAHIVPCRADDPRHDRAGVAAA